MIERLLMILFGEPAQGEPVSTTTKQYEQRSDEGFFEWCQEFNVGCRTENSSVYF